MEDYFQDYLYLRPKNIEQAVTEARDRVARRYITAILAPPSNVLKLKKSNFESPSDRRKAADKMKAEAAQLKRFFRKIAEEHDFLESVDFDSPFDALSALAEVLNSDSEMLFLDIGTLVKVRFFKNCASCIPILLENGLLPNVAILFFVFIALLRCHTGTIIPDTNYSWRFK